MGTTVIGIDPHKRSHTAVVLDEDEEIAAQLRVAADRRQVDRLLAWASDWPERVWAVENVNGLGRLLSQQLVLAGEQVVDVPAYMNGETAGLAGCSALAVTMVRSRSESTITSARSSPRRGWTTPTQLLGGREEVVPRDSGRMGDRHTQHRANDHST